MLEAATEAAPRVCQSVSQSGCWCGAKGVVWRRCIGVQDCVGVQGGGLTCFFWADRPTRCDKLCAVLCGKRLQCCTLPDLLLGGQQRDLCSIMTKHSGLEWCWVWLVDLRHPC